MTTRIVSVIIPIFNGERHVAEALASLEEEPGFQLDIVIVDDGSTDRSLEIVSEISCRDQRLRIISGPHRGVAAARNIGVQAAQGEFVTFLDCDDVCPRGRIARQLRKLLANPEVAYVVGQTLLFEQLDDAQCPSARFAERKHVAADIAQCAISKRTCSVNSGCSTKNSPSQKT